MKVKCNKCGHIGDESEFPHGRDFFQFLFISGCPKGCGNRQSPGGASLRMMNEMHPFDYVDDAPEPTDSVDKILHRARAAS